MLTARRLLLRLAFLLAHRIAFHFDQVSVVNQSVKDAVRRSGLSAHANRQPAVAKSALLSGLGNGLRRSPRSHAAQFRQRIHGPIIDHQHFNAIEPGKQSPQTPIGASDAQITEKRGGANIKRRESVAACLLSQGASQLLTCGRNGVYIYSDVHAASNFMIHPFRRRSGNAGVELKWLC